MSAQPLLTRIGPDTWRVEIDGRSAVVYVAGSGSTRWAFCRGRVFVESGDEEPATARRREVQTVLVAPMPAKVLKIAVTAGDTVHKGDTLVILEAMKMELPLHAVGDATVSRVAVSEGTLVTADQVLVEFDPVKAG